MAGTWENGESGLEHICGRSLDLGIEFPLCSSSHVARATAQPHVEGLRGQHSWAMKPREWTGVGREPRNPSC